MKNILTAGALALAVALTPQAASAAPITGGVSFGGSWAPTGGTGIADATGVDIITDSALINCAFTNTCSGTYAPVTGLLAADYNDFTFNPLGGGISPLWSFTFGAVTYTFSLATVTVEEQDAEFLTLSGTGTLTATGFDDTLGEWTFSGDSAGATIAFSSTSNAVVPEPAMLAMLGIGLIGVGRRYMRR